MNCKEDDCFVKFDMTKREVAWIAGGHNGTLVLVDMKGNRYTPGTPEYTNLNYGSASFWSGAHNGEWFGNNTFFLFDNSYDWTTLDVTGRSKFIQASSRVVEMHVDEAAGTATMVWAWSIGAGTHTMVYGDADRLPTGNVVSCDWPFVQADASSYTWRATEIERVTREPAWELLVLDDPSWWRNKSAGGWYGYSVSETDRVFGFARPPLRARPLVCDATRFARRRPNDHRSSAGTPRRSSGASRVTAARRGRGSSAGAPPISSRSTSRRTGGTRSATPRATWWRRTTLLSSRIGSRRHSRRSSSVKQTEPATPRLKSSTSGAGPRPSKLCVNERLFMCGIFYRPGVEPRFFRICGSGCVYGT